MLSQLRDALINARLPDYLPINSPKTQRAPCCRLPSKRVSVLFLAVFSSFTILAIYHREALIPQPVQQLTPVEHPKEPPLYEDYYDAQERYPQHNPDLPPPEGKDEKFIYHAKHGHSVGWGNVLQEMIFNAVLAHSAKRSFVFYNYEWNPEGPPFTDYNGHLIPSRIPLSALLYGPMMGGSLGPNSDVPRAVSYKYYRERCPDPYLIWAEDVNGPFPPQTTGLERLNIWVDKLNSIEDKCVEIDIRNVQVFDYILMGNKTILDVWPVYQKSPMVANFTWSPLVLAGFQRNAHFFLSPDQQPPPTPLLTRPQIIAALQPHTYELDAPPAPNNITLPALLQTPPAPLPGLLAVHIRRGDYEEHCRNLNGWKAPFTGFNSFPSYLDNWDEDVAKGEEGEAYYAKRCFPQIPTIVEKIRAVREAHELAGNSKLWRVYVMTNGRPDWIAELKEALYDEFGRGTLDGWDDDGIVSSRDMQLSWEEKFVAQAVDEYIGQRAEVFIGNGFSSMSAHISMIRMANGKSPLTVRYW